MFHPLIFILGEKMKKTLLSISIVVALAISGCSTGSEPTNPPVNNSKPPVGIPAPFTPEPTDEPQTPSQPDPQPKPEPEVKPSPTTSSAMTPAVAFAKRWGERYPNVPEYAILKTANGVCNAIAKTGNGWENNPLVIAGFNTAVEAIGMDNNVGLEFAQDAHQNYCASVTNPS